MIIFQKEIERDLILYFRDDSIYSIPIRLMQNTVADQTNNRTIQNDEIMEGKYVYSFLPFDLYSRNRYQVSHIIL